MSALPRRHVDALNAAEVLVRRGEVLACNGLVLEARGPDVALGEMCEIECGGEAGTMPAEVIGFRDGRVLLMPYGSLQGLPVGAPIRAVGRQQTVPVGKGFIGRVVDAFGKPLDERGDIAHETEYPLHRSPMNPLRRQEICDVLETGVRVIDGLATLGMGQRVGIFAGSGVGKSTLLGMLARHAKLDVIVVAMIGERGREVGDFIANALGEGGLARSVVMAATADQPPLVRVRAVHAAHAVAEFFRDDGMNVLLILDSMTRYAMAQREIGLAAGEPPTSRGYPPSVFNRLPQIVERCGRVRGSGSISAVYSVLVEGDDMNEPVSDHMRAILDGHIVLDRQLADRGHLPAIDPLRSVSRLMSALSGREETQLARRARALLAAYERARDLIAMGAYQAGHDDTLDAAVGAHADLEAWLCQRPDEFGTREAALRALATAMQGDARDDG